MLLQKEGDGVGVDGSGPGVGARVGRGQYPMAAHPTGGPGRAVLELHTVHQGLHNRALVYVVPARTVLETPLGKGG